MSVYRAMGSSSKGGGKAKKRELSDQTLTLRDRLHRALSLGIRVLDNKGRRWHCTDAEIQSHTLRTMTAFTNCICSSQLQHPLIKESVSDMLMALEGILQSENERILCLAVSVAKKLVSSLGNSICQYPMLKVVCSLSRLLSSCQLPVAISSATALNCILTNLGAISYKNNNEVWEAVDKANIVGSVICALQDFADGIQPVEYFTEMASLLKTIVWRWPPSRYHVWNNTKLMDKLGYDSANHGTSVTIGSLQLCSALALCGAGAMRLFESKDFLSMFVQNMGKSQPYYVRIETLRLLKHLVRSAEGCSKLISLYCEPIVQGIMDAMDGRRSSCAKHSYTDQLRLTMEACQAALITRWAGSHHSCFWNLEIDRVLLENLLGDCSTICPTEGIFSSAELKTKMYDNIQDTRPYIWDILGWLVINCEEDFIPTTKGKLCCLDILISCACAVAMDLMHKGRSSLYPETEAEPVSRAVLLMVLSPSKYIASQARYCLLGMSEPCGDSCIENTLASLDLIASGHVSLVSDSLRTATNLICLSCYSTLPQFQKNIVQKKGIKILAAIIKRCLNSDIHISRSSIASHLQSSSEGKICCWNHVEDWEGGDILLFYSLQSISQLIWFSNFKCDHYKLDSKEIVVCKKCEDSESNDLIHSLQFILTNNLSPGPRWYSAYILSYFGFYGFPSKLGKRMQRALDESELADLQFMLSNGQTLRVHGAVLVARCPYLLPPGETLLKDRTCDNESTMKQDSEQHGRKLRHEVRISDRVDNCALVKILEYVYTGFFLGEDDLLKPLKTLAKCCSLKSLSCILHRKLPTWGTPILSCNFARALEPLEHSFFDMIMEAKATGVTWNCSICQLSVPHMHTHKIILWASCDYLRALFQSGMHDSHSQIIKVPIGWKALVKLVTWFYSGELPRIKSGCVWNKMNPVEQLHELQSYVELSSLSEFWLLEEVGEESFNMVVSHLNVDQPTSVKLIHFAANLNQWKIVEAVVSTISHLYPKMRDAGDLENLPEEVIEMLRAEYVWNSQKGHNYGGEIF